MENREIMRKARDAEVIDCTTTRVGKTVHVYMDSHIKQLVAFYYSLVCEQYVIINTHPKKKNVNLHCRNDENGPKIWYMHQRQVYFEIG